MQSINRKPGLSLRRMAAGALAAAFVILAVSPFTALAAGKWEIYNQAQALDAKGSYAAAIAKYKSVIPEFLKTKEYGNVGQMYRRIGDDYMKLQNYDLAVANWDQESAYYAKAGRTQDSIAVKNKANLLRSSASLFYETDASAAGSAGYYGAPFEPKHGALLGAYAEQDPAAHNPATGHPFYTDEFPNLTGKKHAAYLIYFTYGQPLSRIQSHIDKAKANGTALEIALEPLKGLSQVQDDAYLRGLARDMAAAGVPIFLRFANEMNGKWVPWFTTPADYIAKFRVVADVMHQEAKHEVAMVWAPGSEPESTIRSYYPGDAYVDWVGVSLYTIFSPALDPLKQGEDRTSHIGKLDTIYKWFAGRKPIFIAEGGVSYMYPEKMQDKTDWAVYKMKELYATLPMLYPEVKAVFWFDSNHDASARVKYYQLSANAKLLAAYKQAVANPYYLGTVGEESAVAYKPVGGATVPATKVKLSGYVKTWSPTLAKVTYEIGGKTVGVAASLPWTASVDFAPYKGKTIAITVKAYTSAGKLVTSQQVKTTVK